MRIVFGLYAFGHKTHSATTPSIYVGRFIEYFSRIATPPITAVCPLSASSSIGSILTDLFVPCLSCMLQLVLISHSVSLLWYSRPMERSLQLYVFIAAFILAPETSSEACESRYIYHFLLLRGFEIFNCQASHWLTHRDQARANLRYL